MSITNQMLYDAWKKVADAVSNNKMQVDVKSSPVDAKLDQILAKLTDVETEIEAIKSTDGIKRIDETVPVQLTGRYVKQSTDSRPAGKEGDQLFLWDTRQVFLHDGTDWREV